MKRNFLEEEHIRRLFIWEVSARERWSVGLFWFSCSPTPPLSTGLDKCWTTPESSAYIWTLPHTNIQWTNIKHTDWHFIASTDVTFHHKSRITTVELVQQPENRKIAETFHSQLTLDQTIFFTNSPHRPIYLNQFIFLVARIYILSFALSW